MQATTNARPAGPAELPALVATLCSYESWFGPYHPQTLGLMTTVAIAYWEAGEVQYARPLLERAVIDLGRHVDRNHDLRLRAIATLKEILLAQRDYEAAVAVEKELLDCQTERLGSDHPATLATRADLATMLLEKVRPDSDRKV
jgi:eukaryotic-like serine/threonine-protein kinase